MGVLAQGLRGGEAARLVATFLSLDADHDGTISLEELRAAARRASPGVSDAEMLRVFRALDVDNTGSVDAREFVAGVLHRGGGRLPASVRAAVAERTFKRLDAAAAGFFTRDAFRSFLALSVPPGVYTPGMDARLDRELDAEFDAMDENRDGRVTWDEFKAAVEAAVAGRGGGGGGTGGSGEGGGGGDGSVDGSRRASFSSGDGWSEVSSEAGGGYASDGGGGVGGNNASSSEAPATRGPRGASPLGRPPSGAGAYAGGGAGAASAGGGRT
jgi:calcium-dependent protein kinase